MSKIERYKAVKVHGSSITIRKFNPCNGYFSLGWRRDHEKPRTTRKNLVRAKN